ncbi:MAG: hypothetical protein JRF33_26405 [Deltaproteobacteria bacterium]|nr:hypothetical protein [Deltaproteobacteria bacterium]
MDFFEPERRISPGKWKPKYTERKKEAKDLLQDIRRFPEFAERYCRIQTTRGQLKRLVLNKIQMWIFLTFIVEPFIAGQPIRLVILKMRQSGISTLVQALIFWYTLGHMNRNSQIIAKNKKQSTTIFKMIQRFMKNLGSGGLLPRFPLARERIDLFEFNKPKYFKKIADGGEGWTIHLDSSIEVLSAQDGDDLGRGGTYQTAHASEAAFWPKLTASLSALLAAVHLEPETMVFVETTANGYNEFHSFWTNLTVGGLDVDSDWDRVFVPWYWDDRYETTAGQKAHTFASEYEELLFARIKDDPTMKIVLGVDSISDNQCWRKILWRRKAIVDICFGNEDMFKQEYPATDVEAFIFSGVSVFPRGRLDLMENELRDPEWRGDIFLEKDAQEHIRPTVFSMAEDPRGKFKVYRRPERHEQYIAFADVAEGKAVEGIPEDKESTSRYDYSCIKVLKVSSYPKMEFVATWHGNCDPDELGYKLVAISKWYNNGMAAWEINGPGRSLKIQVVDICRYKNIYMRTQAGTITEKLTMSPGWHTTPKTKPEMVAAAKSYIRSDNIIEHDSGTFMELKAYSRVGENKYEAAVGHDDRVVAFMGCIACASPIIQMLQRNAKEAKASEENNSNDWSARTARKKSKGQHSILGKVW